MTHLLDILIPVYNEGNNICKIILELQKNVKTPFKILICYDFDEDNTLPAIKNCPFHLDIELAYVKNSGSGPHQAIISGFLASTAPYVLVYPADDFINAAILDNMVQMIQSGAKIVCASRMMPGGKMEGAPWFKDLLVRLSNFALYHFAKIPTQDASNGFRLFSREVIKKIPIQSRLGFTYSIELLVKAHRLGWCIKEVPAQWYEREKGNSRFQVLKWLPAYLRWFFFAFATTFLFQRKVVINE